MTESSECHPDSYMSDGVLLHKLLKPVSTFDIREPLQLYRENRLDPC